MMFIFIILIALFSDYVVWRGIRIFSSRIPGKEKTFSHINRVHRIISFLFILPLILGGFLHMEAKSSAHLLGFYHYFGIFLAVYLPKFCFAGFVLMAEMVSFFKKTVSHRTVQFLKAGLWVSLIPFFLVLYGMKYGKNHLEIRTEQIVIPELPKEFDHLRIILISDLHLGSWGRDSLSLFRMLDTIPSLHADILVCTGDLVNNFHEEITPYLSHLTRMDFPEGKFFVSGNHDYGDYSNWPSAQSKMENRQKIKEAVAGMNFRNLDDQSILMTRNGHTLGIAGTGFYSRKPEKQYSSLSAAMQGTDSLPCVILLTHNPQLFEDSVSMYPNIKLTLSGHTHAGQIGIKAGNFSWSPIALKYKYWKGLNKNKTGQSLYINRGLGFLGFPGRIGMWPEITLVILQSE